MKHKRIRYITLVSIIAIIATVLTAMKPEEVEAPNYARVGFQEAMIIKQIAIRHKEAERAQRLLREEQEAERRKMERIHAAKQADAQRGSEEARCRREEEERQRAEAERLARVQSMVYGGSAGDYQMYAYSFFPSYGWGEYDFQCLIWLWQRESNWNPYAHNSSSGSHGIPQSLPASKMASHGADYWDNGYTQIRWGLDYIAGRYGSPANAWAHSEATGWY